MLSTSFFGRYAAGASMDVVDMPPADWCMTTLQTLTSKYEHLTSVRKANPPYAEAVLNSFKSKLLNAVSSHSFYDSDENSEGEAEWPLGSACAPYGVGMRGEAEADSAATPAANTSNNYLALSPSTLADSADLSAPSTGDAADGADMPFSGADDMVVLPPNIEEALRRFLATSSSQMLSDTFTTFGDAAAKPDSDPRQGSAVAAAAAAAAGDANEEDDDEDDDDARYVHDSGSSSPESLSSPEGIEFLAGGDSVDIFVKGFAPNGSWESVPQPPRPADGSLTPCKRKRSTEEDLQAETAAAAKPANTIPRISLPLSPRKRSRSAGHHDAAAAAPEKPATAPATPAATATASA
ncbi:hypothetical protein H4R18_002403 [Coemansia javaensis]|uniref:Uncharacterized protein n=1 Tax=Coemansia javaensis TaxID=2761396 RepID=A0A9W8HAZ8_9FUNG|nr:hypothetical protein H4R18_002403 [Coemansia javaensis]